MSNIKTTSKNEYEKKPYDRNDWRHGQSYLCEYGNICELAVWNGVMGGWWVERSETVWEGNISRIEPCTVTRGSNFYDKVTELPPITY